MKNILVINGPNLNLLGQRDQSHYGPLTLQDIEEKCTDYAAKFDATIRFFQSNYEGEIIDQIQSAAAEFDGIVINAGGYSHTSVAIRDAIADTLLPVIEVHISNITNREGFRHSSLISPIANGVIFGFGPGGYILALYAMLQDL